MKVEIPAPEPQTLSRSTETSCPPRTTIAHPAAKQILGRRWRAWIVVFLLFAATVGGSFAWWIQARRWITTDNAYVSGHIHQVSARIPGTVLEVLAEENVTVTAGAVLARLDRKDLELKRLQARAHVQQAEAGLQRATSEITRARAVLAEQIAEQRKAELDLQRAHRLFDNESGAISRQELDHAQSAFDAREAGLKAAESAVQSSESAAAAAGAELAAAQATLADAELQLSYTEIVAPASGRIGRKNIEAGNRVLPGQALLGLVGSQLWVTANFKETQLARMRPGQRVRIRLDAFSGRSVQGRIESFAPASGSQFALLPPDNATGNFLKIVQRVPVRIALLQESLRGIEARVVPGMSAIVEVYVGE